MLVLSRKLNEVITIGKDVKITVVEIKRDRIRIGISAPQTTVILREEIVNEKISPSGKKLHNQ